METQMSITTTRNGRAAVHSLAVLGLGFGLAGSLIAASFAPATAMAITEDGWPETADEAYREFEAAMVRYTSYLATQDSDGMPIYLTEGDGSQELFRLLTARAAAKMAESAAQYAITHMKVQEKSATTAGRKSAIKALRQSAVNAIKATHTLSMSIINSIAKMSGVLWVDPTILAPDYYSQVPQNEYGAIVSGNGMGYGNALIIEIAPGGGGHEYDYGSDWGYGWDDGMGGDYYSEESYDSSAAASSSTTTPTSSGGGSSYDGDQCPTAEGEYSFSTPEEACGCPSVDYWGVDANEDGEIDSSEGGSCSELFDGAQSCVPPWRDWFTIVALADGRTIAVPDMAYMIPSDDIRSELFDALPTMIATMADGDMMTLHYQEAWTIGEGSAVGHPITSSMMLQTEALDLVDQELGVDGVLVGYTCSANPAARLMSRFESMNRW